MANCLVVLLLVGCTISHVFGRDVEMVTDEELGHAVLHNDFVLAFLQPDDCETFECTYFLSELKLVADSTYIPNLKIVQVQRSVILKKLSSDPMPRLLFYRSSIPIIFDPATIQRDEVLTWMENNKELNSRPLSSANFEHLTQASTGATTGDWLVLLYDSCSAMIFDPIGD